MATVIPEEESPPKQDKHQPQQSPLLRLPSVIRHRIYQFAGLASCDGTPHTLYLHHHKNEFERLYPHGSHGVLLCGIYGVLLSCRDVYAEAAPLVYSANRFVIYYMGPRSLDPVLALSPLAISSLVSFKIVLNQASCHQRPQFYSHDHNCCLRCRGGRFEEIHRSFHQPPLPGPAPENGDCPSEIAHAQALLDEWQLVASHLAPHITSGRLEFSLVCDIDPQHEKAVDMAMAAVAPLRLFPLLKDGHIRLGDTPDSRLRQIARDAVLHNYGITTPYLTPPATKTTFTTLPRELRLRILEYTDLITPAREVTWSRDDGGYICRDLAGTTRCFKNMQTRCRFFECWSRWRRLPSVGCFCSRRHAAFSATCRCWAPPGPVLFLVCRTLCRDAQFVFFSGNRFIVHDLESYMPWGLPIDRRKAIPTTDPLDEYPYERLGASQFLREVIPTHCIAHLRFLELVFPPYLPNAWLQARRSVMQDWRETVNWLRDKINGPVLTLRLVGADFGCSMPDSYAATITDDQGDEIYRAHMDLWRPLRQLAEGPNGLARFYAKLQNPWQWTRANKDHYYDVRSRTPDMGWSWVEGEKNKLKEIAERHVMGSRYDSLYAGNNKEPETSLWYHVEYDHD